MSISIRKYILILFILSATVGLAQPAVVINDNFNSNAHGWWTGSVETYSMQLEGGKYVIRTTQKDNGRFVTINSFMDNKKIFRLRQPLFRNREVIIMDWGYCGAIAV
jgi:hypothetical protein